MAVPAEKLMLRVLGTLNEAQARWYVAQAALARGRGGLTAMAELSGMSRTTILRGVRELTEGTPLEQTERVRAPGGGRKLLEAADPGLDRALERILDQTTAGDPMSPLRWTSKSRPSGSPPSLAGGATPSPARRCAAGCATWAARCSRTPRPRRAPHPRRERSQVAV